MTGPRRQSGIAPGVRRPVGVALVVALALAWLAPVVGALPASPAAAANTDLTLVTNATYTVQPTHGRVHVVVAIDARNHRGETRTHKYYFDHAFLAVQPGASGFAISGAKGATVHVAERSKDATLLRIDFGARLYGGGGRSLELTFNLVDPGKPVNRQVRVGTGLVTFPVWAFASDGAKGSRVQVHFPAGYDVSVESGDFDSRTKGADGGVTLSTQPLGEPLTYFSYLTAQREAVYKASPLTVDAGGRSIDLIVRGWRDDPAWAGRIGGLFRKSAAAADPRDRASVARDPGDRGPGGREPGGRRLCRAVRPGRSADRGRLLGRPAGRPARGRARLVQRRAGRRPLGQRGVRVAVCPARGREAQGPRHEPEAHGGGRQGRDPAQRLAEHRRRRRGGPAHGDVRLRGLPGARPRDRRTGRGRRPPARLGRGERARRRLPARDGRRVRRRRRLPRRSTARPTGAACSTCSRPRRARTSPTCGASG